MEIGEKSTTRKIIEIGDPRTVGQPKTAPAIPLPADNPFKPAEQPVEAPKWPVRVPQKADA